MFLGCPTLLAQYIEELLDPLLAIFYGHSDTNIQDMAISILGDACAADLDSPSFALLESGFCKQIEVLAKRMVSERDEGTFKLLKSSLFTLSNISADRDARILPFLLKTCIY